MYGASEVSSAQLASRMVWVVDGEAVLEPGCVATSHVLDVPESGCKEINARELGSLAALAPHNDVLLFGEK